MNKTSIEWVKNPDGTPGYSWNPITGCLNGCPYCYARKLANGRLKTRYLANKNVIPNPISSVYAAHELRDVLTFTDPFYPRFWPEKLTQPHKGLGAKGIFVCDMSDLFGMGIPEDWTQKVMHWIRECDWQRFYLLTKQPQNLIKWSPFPDNCWVGVTATNHDTYIKGLVALRNIEAKVKYFSFEPLLEQLSIGSIPLMTHGGISWVIIGAQTKPTVMPKIEWVREIVEACDRSGIPVFLKENLVPMIADSLDPSKVMFYPDGIHLMQEIPR